jgi:hypothetical protein
MRFMIMHKTEPRWEAGAIPDAELIERVGKTIGEMANAKVLRAGEGLRASSQGVRLRFAGGQRTATPGPFAGSNELPAGFAILRLGSLEEAAEWAARLARAAGDTEIDIRPVTESWDIGMGAKPEGLTTRRFMLMRKADGNSEAGVPPTPEQALAVRKLLEEMTAAGVLLSFETLQPSSRGARIKASGGKRTITDGPFAEAKELIAGFVIVEVAAKKEALGWAERYITAVGAAEVDVLALST